MIKEIGGCGYF